MLESELSEENNRLKERIAYLENIINRGSSGNCGAYNNIRGMIINKVQNDVVAPEKEQWRKDSYIKQKERQVMRDLLWEIRVRRVADLRPEHIKQAEEYIKNYKFEEEN